ncbi:DUF6461 domain-containing protein [Nonomuraea jiangxiensis]|uniref:Uncharacterized protein n=1 Tax=Nonomuraea jiangxiensis TaxID=633440 RepID=A0A1G9VQ44_9ACTN|nr:DUF6461 domain-containing protein [Nonomuraea jiangxiensis]SDM74227.1 hypothetical protein SAMN05421869_1549 [Nonomuraea jiangxiensis]
MINDTFAHYRDLLNGVLAPTSDALTWTVIQPITGAPTPAELLERMGLQESDMEPARPVDLTGELEEGMFIGRSGSSFVVVEPNGYQTSLQEVLLRLSTGARACSVFWGVTTPGHLEYAVYGRLVTSLAIHSPDWRYGDQPHALDEELTVLEQVTAHESGHPDLHTAAAMAVVEAATGVRLDLDWLAQPHAMVRREAKVPRPDLPSGGVVELDPDLDARLRLADPSVQALAVQRAVTEVLTQHELLNEPAVRAGLELLAADKVTADPPGLTGCDSLTSRLRMDYVAHRFEVHPDQDPRRARWQAAQALASLFTPHGYDVFQPLVHAYFAAGDQWPSVRRALKALLG